MRCTERCVRVVLVLVSESFFHLVAMKVHNFGSKMYLKIVVNFSNVKVTVEPEVLLLQSSG